jgi:hypothetical protein
MASRERRTKVDGMRSRPTGGPRAEGAQMNKMLRSGFAVATLCLVLGGGAPGAVARPDPGDPVQEHPSAEQLAPGDATPPASCQLTRIGDQLIRCDMLTGAGVEAPSWIPEAGGAARSRTHRGGVSGLFLTGTR